MMIDWVASYAAVIASMSLVWQIFRWVKDQSRIKQEREKLAVYFGRHLLRKLPDGSELRIIPLCVSNLGYEPVIIKNIEMRRENSVFCPGSYNEPEAMLGIDSPQVLPSIINPGETLRLEQFTIAAFRDMPHVVVAISADGKEHPVPENLLAREYEKIQREKKKIAIN